MDRDINLVPAARFGALLSARRRDAQIDLARLAYLSYGVFTVRDLQQIERGRVELSEQRVLALANLYELDYGPIVPQRKQLVVDFNAGHIDAGSDSIDIKDGGKDEILKRYLSLIYIMRGEKPGTSLGFRSNDLIVLSEVLDESVKSVESYLNNLVLSKEKDLAHRFDFFRSKMVVPGAGLLVAVTSVGSLVFVGGSTAASVAQTSSAETSRTIEEIRSTVTAGDELASVDELEVEEISESPIVTIAPIAEVPNDVVSTVAVPSTTPPTTAAPAITLQSIGEQAENLISYDWQSKLPGWQVVYKGERSGFRGLTTRSTKTIEIYIDSSDTPGSVAEVLAHELGHALDVNYLSSEDRQAWLSARSMPDVWWAGEGLNDFQVGAGDFAEGVAALWVGSPSNSAYGGFTVDQLQLVDSFLP